jgi:predicted small secreted protein
MVKVKRTMKRLFTLIALLGLAAGVFAGCNQGGTDTSKSADTNMPPAAASTNK